MAPHPYTVHSLLNRPCMELLRKACKLLLVNYNAKLLRFPGAQCFCLCKADKPAQFLCQSLLRQDRINLHNLSAGIHRSCILYRDFYLKPRFRPANPLRRYRKIRIRKPVSKRKERLDIKTVKVTVSDINALSVFVIFQIFVQIAERFGRRIILIVPRPSRCEPAAWRYICEKHICHRMTALLTGQGTMQDCPDILCLLQNPRQLYRRADI